MNERILVGISGGIDSAATVLLLQDKGYSVEALYIDMLGSEASRKRVEELAVRLKVKLHISECKELFNSVVMQRVLDEHRTGNTPSACTICNPQLKWRLLADVASCEGIERIATGHYIEIVALDGWHYIKMGSDSIKDQSYYLYALGQDVLSRAVTPLGGMQKADVRDYLALRGFEELAIGSESQGVCFAKSGYRDFLCRNLNPTQGDVVDCEGNIIGQHDGAPLYTMGQKRGFELFGGATAGARCEVREVDVEHNRIIVGEPLFSNTLTLAEWWFRPPATLNVGIKAHIRGLGRNVQGDVSVSVKGDGTLQIHSSEEPFWASAKGQPTVLYADGLVVGGGILIGN